MIGKGELWKLARSRLQEAEILHDNGKHGGAVYLSGLAVEIALKARICRTRGWKLFPSVTAEFKAHSLQAYQTHNFDFLLRESSQESKIKGAFFAEWSICASWAPDIRYRAIGLTTEAEARAMIQSAKILLRELWKS